MLTNYRVTEKKSVEVNLFSITGHQPQWTDFREQKPNTLSQEVCASLSFLFLFAVLYYHKGFWDRHRSPDLQQKCVRRREKERCTGLEIKTIFKDVAEINFFPPTSDWRHKVRASAFLLCRLQREARKSVSWEKPPGIWLKNMTLSCVGTSVCSNPLFPTSQLKPFKPPVLFLWTRRQYSLIKGSIKIPVIWRRQPSRPSSCTQPLRLSFSEVVFARCKLKTAHRYNHPPCSCYKAIHFTAAPRRQACLLLIYCYDHCRIKRVDPFMSF